MKGEDGTMYCQAPDGSFMVQGSDGNYYPMQQQQQQQQPKKEAFVDKMKRQMAEKTAKMKEKSDVSKDKQNTSYEPIANFP